MKKHIITSLVLAALAATTLSAGISYGPSIKHGLGSETASYGVAVQNEMIGASVYFGNSKTEGGNGTSAQKDYEDSSTGIGVDFNYVTDALSDNVTFVVGAGYMINNTESKTTSTLKVDSSSMLLNIGTRQEVLGFQLDVTTALVSITTAKSDATGAEEIKTTTMLDGVNLSLTKLF